MEASGLVIYNVDALPPGFYFTLRSKKIMDLAIEIVGKELAHIIFDASYFKADWDVAGALLIGFYHGVHIWITNYNSNNFEMELRSGRRV